MTLPETAPPTTQNNPFLILPYEKALESLGDDYYDRVEAATFPVHILRFRNDDLLPWLGLSPSVVSDRDFIEAFGQFIGDRPFLALRYHGYQFGAYNSRLGDGRGFLYGQIRGTDGRLYDLGTKGSGTTPYSRHADGRLTLKGGVREVLAGEALHHLGVNTSRCLSLVETGEQLLRSDEPSPTRSCVMVRMSHSHIRFGTFERLHHMGRGDLVAKLLDHVIAEYYPHLQQYEDRYQQFYAELVQRTAKLAAQWMAAGFCHGVLNTDNMSITGESFDYGPYAFIETYNPRYIAAYFDYGGRYCFGNQPRACRFNLDMLQRPLSMAIPTADMEAGLAQFDDGFNDAYRRLMLRRLGFDQKQLPIDLANEMLQVTLDMLWETQVGYQEFFRQLRYQFSPKWREASPQQIQTSLEPMFAGGNAAETMSTWCERYHHLLQFVSGEELEAIAERLKAYNREVPLLRSRIEEVWEAIANEDNWEPFYQLLQQLPQ
ncbi:YdiU family protein [Geitlerinema sp. PCC 9228]|jgi:uncharacterized protein YdiU (UPF0061 family)|uniref:protein adenylyltransferase SelO n=1 Tax=Geitlerinema sp. PCC 9228 TaxID=111611 RepID=UPI0008F996EB|nr:YdiU family protein [Geitlerinema sp. PCC 9228]